MSLENFTGCKLAYIIDDLILVYKRDDIATIPFAGLWDFPGGGREGNESTEACVLRELFEEFAIVLPPSRLIYKQQVMNQTFNGNAFFFAAKGDIAEVNAIQFGSEGQCWQLMPIQDYINHPLAITSLVSRLQGYLSTLSLPLK